MRERYLVGVLRPFSLFVFQFGLAGILLYDQNAPLGRVAPFFSTPPPHTLHPASPPRPLCRETFHYSSVRNHLGLAFLTAKHSHFWESLQIANFIKNTLGQTIWKIKEVTDGCFYDVRLISLTYQLTRWKTSLQLPFPLLAAPLEWIQETVWFRMHSFILA